MFNDTKVIREFRKINPEELKLNPDEDFDADDIQISTIGITKELSKKSTSLDRMCELIEAANSMPSKAQGYLQELKKISEGIQMNYK